MFYSPLKYSAYRLLWVTTLFSNIGTWVHTVTSSLLMTHLTSDPVKIALVQTASMLPILLFCMPAGIIADIYPRRKIVLIAQIAMATLAFLMAGMTYSGMMTISALLATTFLLNVGYAFNQPAWMALSSTLLPSCEIKQSAALNNLSFSLSRCIGPAIAGYYFSAINSGFMYFLNGISFLGVIVALTQKTESEVIRSHVEKDSSFVNSFLASFDLLSSFPELKHIILKSFIYTALASCLWATLPYIIINYHHMSGKDLGILIGAAGFGAIINVISIHHLRKYCPDSELTTIAIYLVALVFSLFDVSNSFNLYFGAMVIFGFSWSLSISVFNGIFQADYPEHLRSRLIGMYGVTFGLAQVLSSYAGGRVIQAWGLHVMMFCLLGITVIIANYRPGLRVLR